MTIAPPRRLPQARTRRRSRADANAASYDDPVASLRVARRAASGPQAELADDVVDAIRALRAADVLRQRGTVLRTSGGFEICMDAETARAVCTLRPATGDAAYVIIYDDERGAGEANIRAAFVTPQGHLRIAFHRGGIRQRRRLRERAAASVADVIVDIQADVIPSFSGASVGGGLEPPTRARDEIQIQLERPGDQPGFADDVAALVAELEPDARTAAGHGRRHAGGGGRREQRRFFAAEPLDRRRTRGRRAAATDGRARHRDGRVRPGGRVCRGLPRVTIQPGEVLVTPGSSPAFVYVPTGPGLRRPARRRLRAVAPAAVGARRDDRA